MAVKPKLPPPLAAPPSSVTVKVSAIDTTLWLVGCEAGNLWKPPIPGFDRVRCGTWSFLIEHPSGRKLLYDLGCRKDWENLAPNCGVQRYLDEGVLQSIEVKKDVAQVLTEGGMDLKDIEGIIWSHFHFDHTGDPSTFPESTKLIMGPGSKDAFLPGYPADPAAQTLESDFAGREVMEIDFEQSQLKIGRFKAFDYFGDGSFYILDAPGHTIGHLNALARTHAGPKGGFIHLCGDSFHHAAEIRPSEYIPLPKKITLPRLAKLGRPASVCPGDAFASILREGSRCNHILEFEDPGAGHYADQKFALIYNEEDLRDTVRKVEEYDADDNVFTLCAHDWTVKGVVDEWPQSLNSWKKRDWRRQVFWGFLEDFAGAAHAS